MLCYISVWPLLDNLPIPLMINNTVEIFVTKTSPRLEHGSTITFTRTAGYNELSLTTKSWRGWVNTSLGKLRMWLIISPCPNLSLAMLVKGDPNNHTITKCQRSKTDNYFKIYNTNPEFKNLTTRAQRNRAHIWDTFWSNNYLKWDIHPSNYFRSVRRSTWSMVSLHHGSVLKKLLSIHYLFTA